MKGTYFLGLIKKNILLFSLTLALLVNLAVGLVAYFNLNKMYKTDIKENNTYRNLIKIEELFSYLKDAETARRGFVLTGKKHFLAVYNNALSVIEKLRTEFVALNLNQVEEKRKLITLNSVIQEKLDLLEESIDWMVEGDSDTALQSDFTNQGKVIMDQVRQDMDELIKSEKEFLENWSDENKKNKSKTLSVIILGYSLSFALILMIFYQLKRQILVRQKTEGTLRKVLKVKSDFVSMVSHELRTPLTAIKEGIGIVLDGETGLINEEQEDFLNTAKRNVDRLTRIINDVLDFQKIESGRMEFETKANDINEVVREIDKTMGQLAKNKGLDFKIELKEDLPKIEFDIGKITQVLVNLVGNAIKFTDRGGITITTDRKDNAVCISVHDTGLGIAEIEKPRLFQPFEQLGKERMTGGTGLGLVISKQIIEQHKGKIWSESKFGKGSTFCFVLPITERRG
ncbi:MAG: ATP-binding protein [Candidatus Omnitrophota bacterium]